MRGRGALSPVLRRAVPSEKAKRINTKTRRHEGLRRWERGPKDCQFWAQPIPFSLCLFVSSCLRVDSFGSGRCGKRQEGQGTTVKGPEDVLKVVEPVERCTVSVYVPNRAPDGRFSTASMAFSV